VVAPAKVSLPRDDAPHDTLTEWWYYNGHLWTPEGEAYSYHYVVFLRAHLAMFSIVHASLTEHRTGRRYSAQLNTAGNPSSGSRDGFRFVFGSWEMSGSNGHDSLRLDTADFAFDLVLRPGPPPVLHAGGLLDFKQAGSSYYYSRTRMPTTGTLSVGGQATPVRGQSWFDHQWGEFKATLLGWDWFALQLEEGTDLMLYRLRDRAGRPVIDSGTLSSPDGYRIHLTGREFTTEATGYWRSPVTGIEYPSGWRVRLPDRGLDLRLAPVVEDSEVDARLSSFNAYWEGAVQVRGSHSGVGFVELGGYTVAKPGTGQR
jgi:predicted secreted hydrolase